MKDGSQNAADAESAPAGQVTQDNRTDKNAIDVEAKQKS
jgi:sec-independent protein translocase protein TatA